ncbi:hypothetical protein [Methanopyrus sp.]
MRVLCVCPGTMLRAARDVAERFSELEIDVAYQDDPIDPNRYDLIVLLKATNVNLPTDHDAEVVAVPLDGSTGIQRLNTVPSSVVERAAEYLEKGGKTSRTCSASWQVKCWGFRPVTTRRRRNRGTAFTTRISVTPNTPPSSWVRWTVSP